MNRSGALRLGVAAALTTTVLATQPAGPPAAAAPLRSTFTSTQHVDIVDSGVGTGRVAFPIPDAGVLSPYPSTHNISTFVGTVTDINVTLSGLTHANPDDLDVLLVAPDGREVTLMSDVGGSTDINDVDLTFDDDATFSLPDDVSFVSGGTWRPTNFEGPDPFPGPAATGSTSLSALEGAPVNGAWQLFVVDDTTGSVGNLDGWGMSIDSYTRPYPSTLVVGGGLPAITDVDVHLADLSVGFAYDLDLMLVGPQGQRAKLVSDVGGPSNMLDGVDLVIDDEATAVLPETTSVSSGRYKPTDYGASDSFPPPAPGDAGGSALSVFDGTNPNGTWALYAVTDNQMDSGELDGWSLDIEWADVTAPVGSLAIEAGNAVAESSTVALALTGSDPAPGTGVAGMRFSNDGSTWSPFQPFSPSTLWIIPPGDGAKTVFAQLEDGAGNLSAVLSDTIRLDTVGPRASKYRPTGKSRVGPGVTVVITASEPLERASVNKKAVRLVRVGHPGTIRAKIRYDAATLRIRLDPKKRLARDATYRVKVTSKVVDLIGRRWDQTGSGHPRPLTWTFRTRA